MFKLHIINRDGKVIDTDDCVFTDRELDLFLSDCNAETVRIGEPRFDAYEIDMADGSRGFVRIVGVAE